MIEQHVTSLELSKKLHKAGLDIETVFKYCGGHNWYENDSNEPTFQFCKNDALLDEDMYCNTADLVCEFFMPAPLATELLEVLPHHIYIKEHGDLDIMKMPDVTFLVGYMDCVNEAKWIERKEDELGLQFEGKLPNALALMWLYLKEHELL